MKYTFIMLAMLASLMLTACAGMAEVKAPCDYQGHFCGQKVAINHD